MSVTPRLFACLLSSLCLYAQVTAQTPANQPSPVKTKPAALTIVAARSEHGLRFTAIGHADKLRLEVYNSAGEQLLDTGFRAGSLLDWALIDAQGQTLSDGNYVCVVTAHDLTGTLRVKQGSVTVQGGRAMLELPDTGVLIGSEKQVPREKSLTALPEGDTPAMTVVAHDG